MRYIVKIQFCYTQSAIDQFEGNYTVFHFFIVLFLFLYWKILILFFFLQTPANYTAFIVFVGWY